MHAKPWWQHDLLICGFEGESESSPEGQEGASEEEPEEEGSEEQEEQEGSEGSEGKKKGESEEAANLRKALQNERRLNKQNIKLLKQLQKAEQERKDADLSEGQKSTKRADAAESKVTALAEALKTNKLEQTIIGVARDMKFRDVKDALVQVDRSGIEVEQDEDNPEKVEVDEDAVKKAVAALAKKKKYLIQDDDESGEGSEPSGSTFNGRRKSKETLDKETLEKKYPALRGV